jgi:hypothetical protein
MNERAPYNRRLLNLLRRPDVVEIIITLSDLGGSATLAQLQGAGFGRPMPVLRSLAVAGQVWRSPVGSWDAVPTPADSFELTPAGRGLAETLTELESWGRRNLGETDSRRHHQCG